MSRLATRARHILPWLLISLAAGVLPVHGATLRVGPQEPLTSIGEAVRQAAVGDTLRVGPGTYREDVRIDKPLELLGEGRPRIVGTGEGDVIVIAADDVVFSGFSVSGSGSTMMTSDAGIKIYGAGVRVIDNDIVDNLFGVYLRGCRDALVEGNRIRGRAEVDLGRRGAGVHFFDAHHNVVRKNDVRFVRDGVYFDHSDFNLVEENEFSHLRYGVHYMYCEDNRFFGNVFRDSLGGVAVMYTERVIFRDNRILDNREGYNSFGLLLKDCLDSVAEGNAIVNNVNGIFLDNSHRNRFERNLVAYNDVGIMLYASSLENVFTENDFIGNLATLHTVGRADAEWSPGGRGNHYSDYAGYDLDLDGVGDTPHRLQDAFEYLTGSRPLLRLFLMSPAADALAAAEQSFPIVPSSDEVDTAPRTTPASGVRVATVPGRRRGAPVLLMGSLVALFASGWLSWRWRT